MTEETGLIDMRTDLALPRRNRVRVIHLGFAIVLLGAGIPICVSLRHNDFPLGFLVIEAGAAIAWAIFSRISDIDSTAAE